MALHQEFKRTRIAPTPSGYLHFGNIASFVLTIGLAKKVGASVLLRIDDLDQERVRKEYIDDIFDTLHFLGLPWDEGPRDTVDFVKNHSQRSRLDLYEAYLDALVRFDQVFACTCSRKQLVEKNMVLVYPGNCKQKNIPLSERGVSWRLKTYDQEKILVHRLVGGAIHHTLPYDMHQVVVRKKDGMPSYQIASVADDLYYGIDLVVRGADLLGSTIIQHSIAQRLGKDDFCKCTFLHHPLITTTGGEKLSKSAGDTSIHQLRKKGLNQPAVWREIAGSFGITAQVTDWKTFYFHLEQKWIN